MAVAGENQQEDTNLLRACHAVPACNPKREEFHIIRKHGPLFNHEDEQKKVSVGSFKAY